MGGTREGGRQAYIKNTAKDPDFYRKIGAIGGKKSKGGGFAEGIEGRKRASYYGAIGGSISKRRPKHA